MPLRGYISGHKLLPAESAVIIANALLPTEEKGLWRGAEVEVTKQYSNNLDLCSIVRLQSLLRRLP